MGRGRGVAVRTISVANGETDDSSRTHDSDATAFRGVFSGKYHHHSDRGIRVVRLSTHYAATYASRTRIATRCSRAAPRQAVFANRQNSAAARETSSSHPAVSK